MRHTSRLDRLGPVGRMVRSRRAVCASGLRKDLLKQWQACDKKLGVIFDMDGVLVDTGWAHRQAWHDLAEKEGLEISDEFFRRTFGMQNAAILPMLRPGISTQEMERLSDWKEQRYRDLMTGASGARAGGGSLAQGPQTARLSPGHRLLGPAGEPEPLLGPAVAGGLVRGPRDERGDHPEQARARDVPQGGRETRPGSGVLCGGRGCGAGRAGREGRRHARRRRHHDAPA